MNANSGQALAADGPARVVAQGLAFTECPRWHKDRLWFADILAGEVNTFDPKDGKVERVLSLAAITNVANAWPTGLGWDAESRLIVVSMKDCKLLRETKAESRKFDLLADLSSIYSHHVNDMVVDSAGRAYVGGYSFDVVKGEPPTPSPVVLVTPDGKFKAVGEDLMMPNGMVLLNDGKTLVVAESRGICLTAFDVDRASGALSKKRMWAKLPKAPDGICADAEGCIWAPCGPHEFIRVREGGEIVDRVSIGENSPIACMLGGPQRKTLYMCTNKPRPAGATADQVAAGRYSLLQAAEVKVAGAGLP